LSFSRKKLTLYRKKEGLSINTLAKLSGVSKANISNIENGKNTNPGVETVDKLAKPLKIFKEDLEETPRGRTPYRSKINPSLQHFVEKMEKAGRPVSDEMVKSLSKIEFAFRKPGGPSDKDWSRILNEILEHPEERIKKK